MKRTEANPPFVFVTGTSQLWGAERSLLAVATGMAGIERRSVALVTSNRELARAWRTQVNEDVTLVRASEHRVWRNLGFLLPMRRLLSVPATVVLFDFYLLPAAFLRLGRRRAAIAVDVHDSVRKNPRRRPYFWLMGRVADRAICVSRYIAEQVSPTLVTTVVHRPIPDLGPSQPSDSQELRVGVVGQVSRHKGVLEAIDIASAAGTGVELVVRGDAPPGGADYLSEVIARGEQVLGSRFAFEGYVPTHAAFDKLDVLLFLNADEPSGRVIAEAQMAGVLPIVPSSGGAREFAADPSSGLTYARPEQAAELLRDLLADPARRRHLGQTARLYALDHYQSARQAARYRDALSS